MKFSFYLLFEAAMQGTWKFLRDLPFAVLGYIVVHGVAKFIERRAKLILARSPIYGQPFRHYLEDHEGKLKDCKEGQCAVL